MTNFNGLHHVTAIASDGQRNLDFYTKILGLRLVKLTVNFDDPTSYHLYYGDQSGAPGTILTFFVWAGGFKARAGRGETSTIALAVPTHSLSFWRAHLAENGVDFQEENDFEGAPVVAFSDPDGIALQLVAAQNESGANVWQNGEIRAQNAIVGVHHVKANVADLSKTARVLTDYLGLQAREKGIFAPQNGLGALQLIETPQLPRATGGAGSIHHIAFRVPDEFEQKKRLAELQNAGFHVSPVMDRTYFESIYFREPNGVLLEIATDAPGFLTDESLENLGAGLKLPPQYEANRARIEAGLAPLVLPQIEEKKGEK